MPEHEPPRKQHLSAWAFAREEPLAVLLVLAGLVAWGVFLWWAAGVLA